MEIIKDLFFSFYGHLLLITNVFFAPIALAKESSPLRGLQKNNRQPSMTDIHDIKPLVDIGIDIPWAVVLVGILILLMLSAAFFYWRYLRKAAKIRDVIPELPPEANAHRALNKISDVKQLDGKTFYFNLSAILRQYLYERFNMNAPEMTTEELLPQIKTLNLDKDLFDGISRLCQGADSIKFAGLRPQIRQMETDLIFAHKFVDGTALKMDDEIKQL